MKNICVFVIVTLVTGAASAQVREWNNPAGGFWMQPQNWAGSDVPNSPTESARLGTLAAPYIVRFESGTNSLFDLFVGGKSTLVIEPTASQGSARFELDGQSLVNEGLIELSPGRGRSASMYFRNGATLTGGGVLRLREGTYIMSNYLSTLTNASGHTIAGAGGLLSPFINDGTVVADRPGGQLGLSYDDSFYTSYRNNAAIVATSGGILTLNGAWITQAESGVIRAEGGVIRSYNDATITGGSLEAVNGGEIHFLKYGGKLTNVTLRGNITVDPIGELRFASRITNLGTLTTDASTGPASSHIYIESTCTLDGDGEIVLSTTPGGVYFANIYAARTLTHSAEHTIRGNGILTGTFTNHGTITADVAGGDFTIRNGTLLNHGVISSRNGSNLSFLSMNVTGQPGSQLSIIGGGEIRLHSTSMMDVTLQATSPSRVIAQSGTQTFRRVVFAGEMEVLSGVSVDIAESFQNSGRLLVNSDGGSNPARITLQEGSSLGGSGWVHLNAPTDSPGRAFIRIPSGSAANLPGHTITGQGSIAGNLVNRGVLSPGDGIGTIEHKAGTYSQIAEGELEIEVGDGASDLFGGLSAKVLGGRLSVRAFEGFEFHSCRKIIIITGSSITGEFSEIVLPPVRIGSLRVHRTATSLELWFDPADSNGDGFRDQADYTAFVDAFETGSGDSADFNGDGFVDLFDYADFVAAFETGC